MLQKQVKKLFDAGFAKLNCSNPTDIRNIIIENRKWQRDQNDNSTNRIVGWTRKLHSRYTLNYQSFLSLCYLTRTTIVSLSSTQMSLTYQIYMLLFVDGLKVVSPFGSHPCSLLSNPNLSFSFFKVTNFKLFLSPPS